MKRVHWGILATGRIARQFVADLEHVPGAVAVAVASRRTDTAAAFAREFGIARHYDSYAELLADDDVDAVYIATPHTLHLDNARHALRAGKAVLCEKPLTVSVEQAATLVRTARDSGVYLLEGMWTWFLPAVQTALDWYRQGRVGALRHIKADFGYPLLPYDPQRREYAAELGGGALLEMGIYPIALCWLFARADPQVIEVVGRRAPNGVDDDVCALFRYPEFTATLATSFRCKLQNWAYVIGEDGYIAIPDFWRARECRLYRLDELVDRYADDRAGQGFEFEAAAVGADLAAGRTESTIVTLDDSLRFQQHIAAIRKHIS